MKELLVAEGRKRLGAADSLRFVSLLNRLPIRVVPRSSGEGLMEGLMTLARAYGLPSHDASCLHMAISHGIVSATRDEKLKAAAIKAKVAIRALK